MTKREITSLSLCVLGFYLLGSHLPFYGLTLVSSLTSGNLSTCLPALVAFAFAIFLITNNRQIAQRLFAQTESHDETTQQDEREPNIQAVAFSVVGLLLVAQALPSFIGIINLNTFTQGTRIVTLRYLGPLLKIIVGIVIFCNSTKLTSLWRRINKHNDQRTTT